MKVRAFSLLSVALACLLAHPQVTIAAPPEKNRSPYAGKYTGTFTALFPNGMDQEGESTFIIDDAGNCTGETINKTLNEKYEVKGTILKDNKMAIVFKLPGGQTANAYGTVSKTSTGGIAGTLTERLGTNVLCAIEFDAKPAEKEPEKAKEKSKEKE